MDHHRHTHGLGNGVDRDVIMRRADAAGGEQIIVARTQRVDRLDNRVRIIGHHAHFTQADALNAQPTGDLGDILVLRPAG
jgi:hypothetical protein